MELLVEKFAVYSVAILLCLVVIILYLRKQRRDSKKVEEKIAVAKLTGMYEPVSLHPVVDEGSCIRTGACIAACPEKDILGIRNGKATTINASQCIGHGACFHACPTQAITLCIGTEKRGVDLPHMDEHFESNIPGIYIAGELGGMGLIKNAVEQGRQSVENIVKSLKKNHQVNARTLEQDTLGGAVFTFPRSKIVMTSAMDLPLYGKVKLYETSKTELLHLWKDVLRKNNISIRENAKVEVIEQENDHFKVGILSGEQFTAKTVLLAIGRRGTPRKLEIPGETLEKGAYRLLEPELISGKEIMIVGGGDSAIESALMLADENKVTISYRSGAFSRIKPMNQERIRHAVDTGKVNMLFNTSPAVITADSVILNATNAGGELKITNDLVYIFAGGELPAQFLQKIGLQITKKFGEAVLKH